MNQVTLIGNLVRVPEMKESANNKKYTRFTIAVNSSNKEKTANFIELVAFGTTAELLTTYGEKGRKLVVTGKLSTSKYEDKDGNAKTTLGVIADNFEFLSKSKNSGDVAATVSE